MPDSATSSHPAVQRQLDRLSALGPGSDILGLDRITRLLGRIGNPHLMLPAVLHVAGTNSKGSTCAYLRAAIEGAGLSAHVYSSPHLVRFNERIRLAGRLIEDDALAVLLEEVLDAGGDIGASFFEVTTAAAFLAFSRTLASVCIVEVGLGGRLDATNVIPNPAVTAIAQLGVDHQSFLGSRAEDIAAEKAGIAKRGVMMVTMRYPDHVARRVAQVARDAGATLVTEGESWRYIVSKGALRYTDARGTLVTDLPALPGPHQAGNLALALAMLRFNPGVRLTNEALLQAPKAQWPARMQRLSPGPLTALLPPGSELWLDGGHNPAAADAVATTIGQVAAGRPIHLVLGMLENKDAPALIAHFPFVDSLIGVPVPDHAHHPAGHLAEVAREAGIGFTEMADSVEEALTRRLPSREPAVVLVLGSLYLAGKVLAANNEIPD